MEISEFTGCCSAKILYDFFDYDWAENPTTVKNIKKYAKTPYEGYGHFTVSVTEERKADLTKKMQKAGFKPLAKFTTGHPGERHRLILWGFWPRKAGKAEVAPKLP